MFLIRSAVLKSRAPAYPVFVAHNESQLKRTGNVGLTPTQQEIKDTAKTIYDKVAPAFQKPYGVSLSERLTKVTDLNLQQH